MDAHDPFERRHHFTVSDFGKHAYRAAQTGNPRRAVSTLAGLSKHSNFPPFYPSSEFMISAQTGEHPFRLANATGTGQSYNDLANAACTTCHRSQSPKL